MDGGLLSKMENFSKPHVDDGNSNALGSSTDSSGDKELPALLSDDEAEGSVTESSD